MEEVDWPEMTTQQNNGDSPEDSESSGDGETQRTSAQRSTSTNKYFFSAMVLTLMAVLLVDILLERRTQLRQT